MKSKCLVIADTGVILSLIVADKLKLLETLFTDVFIPQAVLVELKAIGNPGFDNE
jgi:predicted nucleic acid-binding protein